MNNMPQIKETDNENKILTYIENRRILPNIRYSTQSDQVEKRIGVNYNIIFLIQKQWIYSSMSSTKSQNNDKRWARRRYNPFTTARYRSKCLLIKLGKIVFPENSVWRFCLETFLPLIVFPTI